MVRLPVQFPQVLPEIIISRTDLPIRIADVEASGKICIAPTSGVLLDADRPFSLIDEALNRAIQVVARGIAGELDDDLQEEWLAYWDTTDTARTYSICTATDVARRIVAVRASGQAPLKSNIVVADTRQQVEAWAAAIGAGIDHAKSAFFIPVERSFLPPEFGAVWTSRKVMDLLRASCNQTDVRALNDYLGQSQLPVTIILSLPAAPIGRRLVGIRFEEPDADAAKLAAKGFRPGHVPASRSIGFGGRAPVTRLRLDRVDRDFLVVRGGGARSVGSKTVTVVGVGAIGSEIAVNLAAMGVGTLHLIDHEDLEPGNIHRHVLGFRYLWQNKATALASEMLGNRFPHLSFKGIPRNVEAILHGY